ncbi:unnamed protein product, partial [Heterosigma akashiwo]
MAKDGTGPLPEPQPAPIRWLVLVVVCMLVFSLSLPFLNFGDQTASCIDDFYGFQGVQTGAYLATVFIVGNIIGSILAFSQVYKPQRSMIIGGCLCLVGLGLKALSIVKTNDRYDPVLWGQLVCGISLPYALNVTATVAG